MNPIITWSSDESEKQPEGCLSIPGLEEVVLRPFAVRVEGLDPNGEEVIIEAEDLYARALQHEIDHLDGVLFLDRVSALKRKMLLKKWKKLESEASRRSSSGGHPPSRYRPSARSTTKASTWWAS